MKLKNSGLLGFNLLIMNGLLTNYLIIPIRKERTTKMQTKTASYKKADLIVVRHPQFVFLGNLITICQEVSDGADEPQCIAVQGAAGTGKTTLAKDYTKSFPIQNTKRGKKIPVFY